jgi:hypothetical protein
VLQKKNDRPVIKWLVQSQSIYEGGLVTELVDYVE